ncbi:MAG: hypothetical protein AUJ58_07270 [Zetaproteobacteria bacterium CG1_02_55_237]|nr:MAG: hypothetical protein AUJ58_07270 [Zetaproteobacteria bacterium CG1_02_55_237]
MRRGGLIAHHTGTLPGVAAVARNQAAARQLCNFKQRRGPFLLLADSVHSALGLCIHLPSALRKTMSQAWPGPATFIVPAAGADATDITPACFGGRTIGGRAIAIRVDADLACRYLAHLVGGLLISSSLNRKKQPVQAPSRRLRMRWHRHLNAQISFGDSSGCASSLLKWSSAHLHILRGSMPAQH